MYSYSGTDRWHTALVPPTAMMAVPSTEIIIAAVVPCTRCGGNRWARENWQREGKANGQTVDTAGLTVRCWFTVYRIVAFVRAVCTRTANAVYSRCPRWSAYCPAPRPAAAYSHWRHFHKSPCYQR